MQECTRPTADLKRAQHCWEASPAKASICVNSVSNWYASLGSRAIVFVLTHLTHIAYAYIAHYSKKSNFVEKLNFEHIWFFAPKIWILMTDTFWTKIGGLEQCVVDFAFLCHYFGSICVKISLHASFCVIKHVWSDLKP